MIIFVPHAFRNVSLLEFLYVCQFCKFVYGQLILGNTDCCVSGMESRLKRSWILSYQSCEFLTGEDIQADLQRRSAGHPFCSRWKYVTQGVR